MSGGAYIDPYSRGQPVSFHRENLALIFDPNATCYDNPLSDIVQGVCENIRGYDDTISTTSTEDGVELLRQTTPETDYEENCIAQKRLLTHSLWLVHYEMLQQHEIRTAILYQTQNLPDEAAVIGWIDGPGDRDSIRESLSTKFRQIELCTSRNEFERNIHGYLNYSANPANGSTNVIEWSHQVAQKIDSIG